MQLCTGWCAALVSAAGGSSNGNTASETNWGAFLHLVLLWTIGALVGWMLPRPKPMAGGAWLSNAASLFSATPWRRIFLAWHGAIIMREVWYHFTCPGTFRRLTSAVLRFLAGKGWSFDFPTAYQPGAAQGTPCDPAKEGADRADTKKAATAGDAWYVTPRDFEYFKRSVVGEAPEQPVQQQCASGAGPWEQMMDREIPGVLKYTAWRRTLANNKTEYRSVTYSPDATAEEFMDLYLDDDNRPSWDTMIIHHETLEHGDFAQRQQVVRWVRRFPFSFISDREYVIAKRLFRDGQDMYGITKAIDHPRAPPTGDVVRMDVFYSMWRSRTVPCPWNSGRPACETVLLHHEQMKVPENLSRFAVKHGMWGFVRKLSSETPKFVEARRQRCDPYQPDAQAFGAGHKPNPPVLQPTLLHTGAGVRGSSVQLCADLSTGATPTKSLCGAVPPIGRTDTSTSALSSLTTQSSVEPYSAGGAGPSALVMALAEGAGSDLDAMRRGSTGGGTGSMTRTKSVGGKVRGLAAFAIASGLALLLQRSTSSERFPPPAPSGGAHRKSAAGSSTAPAPPSSRRMRRARTQASLTGMEGFSQCGVAAPWCSTDTSR